MSTFPTAPDNIRTDVLNATAEQDTHPLLHNQVASAVNAIQGFLMGALQGSLTLIATAANTVPFRVMTASAKSALVVRTEGTDGNQMNLAPDVNDGRVMLSMWSRPEEGGTAVRCLSIQTHGTNNTFDPTHQHVTFYTESGTPGTFMHMLEWYWGNQFDAMVRVPDAGLEVGNGVGVNGSSLLRFNIDRAWKFMQNGTGASAALELRSENDNKTFKITSMDGTRKTAVFIPSNTTNLNHVEFCSDGGSVMIGNASATIGFFGATQVAKPTITGSRAGNAALASLLAQGAALGLWTDGTSA